MNDQRRIYFKMPPQLWLGQQMDNELVQQDQLAEKLKREIENFTGLKNRIV